MSASLADRFPALAAEADGWDPSRFRAGSRAHVQWRCATCGTSWSTEIRNRTRGYGACPTCTRGTHPPLTITHPELAAQVLPPVDPALLTHGSKLKVWWQGPAGHVWQATVANRAKGSACPICSRHAVARAKRQPAPGRSLADLYPQLSAEAVDWDPHEFRPGSAVRQPWTCSSCGHRWTTTISARTSGKGCPACARRRNAPRAAPPST